MNPASRILGVVNGFNNVAKDSNIEQAWMRFLEIEQSPHQQEEVLTVVQALFAEIRLLENRLREVGVPEQNYLACANQLRGTFSPTQFSAQWSSHKAGLNQAFIPLTLQWADWALSEFNENDLVQDDIDALKKLLAEQEELLSGVDLPIGLRDLLERQVASLKSALRLYQVKGTAPLRAAVAQAVGEMTTAPAVLVEELKAATPETRSAFERGVGAIKKAAEVADYGSKIFKFGKEFYEVSVAAWPLLKSTVDSAGS